MVTQVPTMRTVPRLGDVDEPITVTAVAEEWGMSDSHIRRLIRLNHIRHERVTMGSQGQTIVMDSESARQVIKLMLAVKRSTLPPIHDPTPQPTDALMAQLARHVTVLTKAGFWLYYRFHRVETHGRPIPWLAYLTGYIDYMLRWRKLPHGPKPMWSDYLTPDAIREIGRTWGVPV